MKQLAELEDLIQYETMEEFWAEQDEDDPPQLVYQVLEPGTKIYLRHGGEDDGNPVIHILEIEEQATIGAEGFDGSGYTSDHWVVIQEEGQDEVWAIYGEPIDITEDFGYEDSIVFEL
jgi:hypothetical protein